MVKDMNSNDTDGETVKYDVEKSVNGNTAIFTLWIEQSGYSVRLCWEGDGESGDRATLDGNRLLFSRPRTLLGTDSVDGLNLPASVVSELNDDRETLEAKIDEERQAERDSDLVYQVEQISYRISDYPTSAVVLKPQKTRFTDEQTEADEEIREVAGTAGKPGGREYIDADAFDAFEEGDTLSLDEVRDALESEFPEGVEEVRERKAAAKERAERKEQRRNSLDLTVRKRWEKGRGEGHAIHARVTVEDPETGEQADYYLRNAVDIGFQISTDGDLDYDREIDEEFDERAREYIREFSPITTGFRMTDNDRGY